MARQIEPPNPTAAALVDIAQRATPNMPPMQPPEPELIGKVPAKKTNGPLPRENFARGLAGWDQLEADNQRLEHELKEARLLIATLEQQLEEIKSTRAAIEQRINECVAQRDDAVRKEGELRGALNSVAAICVRYHHAEQQD